MIKIIYRQRKGTLKCLKENHKCQAQSQLYQYAIHCNWLSVEERGNNCQIQGYISQTVIQFDKKMSYLSSHQIASTPGRFLSLLKDATVKSQNWDCNFLLQPYKIRFFLLSCISCIPSKPWIFLVLRWRNIFLRLCWKADCKHWYKNLTLSTLQYECPGLPFQKSVVVENGKSQYFRASGWHKWGLIISGKKQNKFIFLKKLLHKIGQRRMS